MKTIDELDKQNINKIVEQCYESVHLNELTRRTMEILDGKYEKADLNAIISKCISQQKREQLYINYYFDMKTSLMVL
jgi:hypothetical protein